MADLVTFVSAALPPKSHVVSVRGREAISEPYRFEIGLRIDDENFDMDAAIRARGTLEVHRGDGGDPTVIHGMLASMELVHQWRDTALYRAVLVPRLWNLGISRHSRVFTDNTIPEILEAVLKFGGLEAGSFELRLRGTYPTREHVFQYRESNLAFLTRWMDRLGMYYFFEAGDDGEKLVITDVKSSHAEARSDAVRYVPDSAADAMANDALDTFHCVRTALPATVKLLDYDHTKPTLDVSGSASVGTGGVGEVHLHDQNFRNPEEGARLARVRAEALLATEKIFHGRGRVFGLKSGYCFKLDEHPRAAFNAEYLVVELEHFVNQSANDATTKRLLGLRDDEEGFGSDEYGIRFKAILAGTQFRSPERALWPRIDGYEAATVCGDAESTYAQLDDEGRYKVRIHCDESDLLDGKASTWVRMIQPHGGGKEGFHFPLRKGTEVLIVFLGGDPDQPVLAGVVPNAHTPSPVTRGNHTLNVLQTGGLNRFELQDEDGKQHVKLSTPVENTHIHMGAPNDDHNLHICTDGDAITFIGRNWDGFTHGEKYEYVEHDATFEYDENHFVTVTGGRWENIQSHVSCTYDKTFSLSVTGDHTVWVGGGRLDEVEGGDVTENFAKKHALTVGKDQHISVGGKLTEDVKGDVTETYLADKKTTITGKHDLTVLSDWKTTILGHDISLKTANETNFVFGMSNEVFVGLKGGVHIGGQMNTFIGVKMELALSAAMSFTAGAKCEVDAAVECETIAATMKTYGAELAAIGSIIRNGGIEIDLTGLKLL